MTRVEDDIRIQIFARSDVTSQIGPYALVTMSLSYRRDHTHIIHVHQNSDIMSLSEKKRFADSNEQRIYCICYICSSPIML